MQSYGFEFTTDYGINNCGKLTFFNNKKIATPVCWFGLSIIESKEFQLEVFKKSKIEAFLSNAYDLYYTDIKGERHELIRQLQKRDLAHKMDSGGFQLMKSKIKGTAAKFPLTPKMALDKQVEIGCDCAVQLDFPFGPGLSKTQKMKRLNITLENLNLTFKLIDNEGINITLLPVIHTVSDDLDLLIYGLNKIEEILGESPLLIGIGSLVPLVKTMKGSKKNGIDSFLYALITLRKMIPDAFIHAFGIGGTMAYLAILAGIDSYDSNGWIQKSAYGVIQLPGISDRFLQKETHNRPYLIPNRKYKRGNIVLNEIDEFMKCKCEACKPFVKVHWNKNDWKKKQKAFIGREQEPKLLRSIHNVSLYQSELLKIREAIKNNNLTNFIKKRLKNGIYFKHIDFIEKMKKEDIKNLREFQKLLNLKNKNISEFF
jgi:tRNA-guanine family transglycosylase